MKEREKSEVMREWERESKREWKIEKMLNSVCLCVWERERESKREWKIEINVRQGEREREKE